MSTASRTNSAAEELRRAERLKHELTHFVTDGPLKEEYERQHKIFFELADPADDHEVESSLDWFLFDWLDDRGEGAIDRFIDAREDLSDTDRETLMGWTDSLSSVFEIATLGKHALTLKDLESNDDLRVRTSSDLKETPLKRGQFIAARLLPLGDEFIFSGLQFIMPDRMTALEALEMRRSLEALDSPEAIEKAQQEQCSAFCELFGCDELTVRPQNLTATLARFQQYLIAERRDPETGQTKAEQFKAEFGRDLNLPELPALPDDFDEIGEITILCDEFDGIVLLPEFNKFRRVFDSENLDRDVPDWQDILWMYVRDPDIPIVAFERVAERHPKRVEKVMRALLGDKEFSIEHLYAVLLHYKEPMDGFEDLEDDTRLWDLLNGNNGASGEGREEADQPRLRKRGVSDSPAKTPAKKSAAQKPAKRPAAKKSAGRSSGGARKTATAKSGAAKATKGGAKKSSAAKRATATKKSAATKSAAAKKSPAAKKTAAKPAKGGAAAKSSRARSGAKSGGKAPARSSKKR